MRRVWLATGGLLLSWLVFAQVVTFVLGLSLYKEENLFTRWIPSPAE